MEPDSTSAAVPTSPESAIPPRRAGDAAVIDTAPSGSASARPYLRPSGVAAPTTAPIATPPRTEVVSAPPTTARAGRVWAWRAGVSLIAVAPLLVCLAVAVRSFCAVGASTGTESATTERDLSSAATSAAWRSAAVTAIFPATLESIGDSGYRRLGVARLAGCGVLPAALRDRLAAAHCVAVLRATYVDTTRTAIATIGVVVLDGPSAARAALARAWPGTAADDDSALMPGVVPVPGTTAAGFENASRVGWHAVITQRGTYLCYAVTGFADGRRGSTAAQLRSGAWRTAQSPPGQAAEDLPATIGAELDAAVDTLGGRP